MLLSEVGYARPATLEQALGVLAEYPGARALAGGQTLINVMKARAAAPDVLVDLSGIAALKGIELGSDGTLAIGPMTTYTELIVSAEARARSILGEVCAQIADVQVRNRVTLAGAVDESGGSRRLSVGSGGNLTLSQANSFTGGVLVSEGGRLAVQHPQALGHGPEGASSPANVTVEQGIIELIAAMRQAIGVEINREAVAKLKRDLLGATGGQ
jgi:autotransporter-associated beta strand protein